MKRARTSTARAARYERREKMIDRMTPIAKALPASRDEWERRIAQYQEACFLDDSIWEVKP